MLWQEELSAAVHRKVHGNTGAQDEQLPFFPYFSWRVFFLLFCKKDGNRNGSDSQKELGLGKIVVVAGFQGVDPDGDITTLGRGGSDTTAVALAAWLKADICQIFTDVDGVYDRDPRMFPDARRFRHIRYDTMMALVENGAQVLHDRSVELAREHGIRLEVLSAFTGEPGTIVGELESF